MDKIKQTFCSCTSQKWIQDQKQKPQELKKGKRIFFLKRKETHNKAAEI